MSHILSAIWVVGAATIGAIHFHILSQMLKNLAPGVQPRDVVLYKRFASSVDASLFDIAGKRYQRMATRNEVVWGIWVFVVGPLAYWASR
jgi:hypothetical protein